ncbi:MAG TPA: PQQ-dependent sugar dehydrogenase, partial [Polyangia bacterium]|nr:PQQ-dependent sugar dehydrogenase [Polyangia bacterium]
SQAPGDSSRWFVVEKGGAVKTFPDANPTAATTFIDISARVDAANNESGLLGMAFHPSFATNHQVFLSYDTPDNTSPAGFHSVISRFVSNDGGATLDQASEQVLLTIAQPFTNHNGGNIVFGPDGYLYAGFGDGGSGGDPMKNGQNVNVLLGKMLRLDVDGGTPYAIPPTNPFASGGGKKEIYAWGLRNPWRWSFDSVTGELWCGDVGQDLYEEIDKIQLGGNYGWNVMEASHCYNAATCNMSGLILPIAEYDHSVGNAITGGYIYRGTAITSLIGTYIYGDEVSGRIWGLFYDTTGKATPQVLIDNSGHNISSFGQGNDGELYLCSYGDGKIYKLVPPPTSPPPSTFPQLLSQTGCVDPQHPTVPAAGLIPYDLNAPLWSDGAAKRRWIALPDGKQIHVNTDGDWDLPIGSVVVKEFSVGGKRVETRLLMHHADGDWAGYSYEWNDAETDASLLPAGKVKAVGGQSWTYPARAECLQCHSTAAGRTLGLESGQLNRDYAYPTGRLSNELATLAHIGLFDAPFDQAGAARYPTYDGTDPLDARARSYLHANCSICHRPNGNGQGPADLRYSTAFKDTMVCNAMPQEGDLGLAGALLLIPGMPAKSILSLRMHALDVNRMPPLASHVVDAQGTSLIDSWIQSLTACPP